MRLSEILDRKGYQVHTTSPQETVMQAARKLVANNIGALAVVDDQGKLAGIFSERDILRMLPREAGDLNSVRVSQHMSKDVVTAAPTDDVEHSLNTMTTRHIRHLPVCAGGKLAGMVSIGDLVKSQLDEAVFETKHLTSFVTGQYPA